MATREELDPLEAVLIKCGIGIKDGKFVCGNANQALVRLQRNLEMNAKERAGFVNAVEKRMIASDSESLRSLLKPMENGSGNDSSGGIGIGQKRDSLMKLLLHVHSIQQQIIGFICEAVITHSASEEENQGLQEDLSRLLLHQLRFLNFVQDGNKLATHLTETLETICSMGLPSYRLPQEIINIIPEILEDSQHALVVSKLQQLLEEERELTVPIIESLGNLRVPSARLNSIRQTVLGILSSAPFTDLPVAIRFLLESLGKGTDSGAKETRAQVVSELRKRFMEISRNDIAGGTVEATETSQYHPSGNQSENVRTTCIQAILQTLSSCLIVRSELAKAYLESMNEDIGVSVIDFWVLVSLWSSSAYSRSTLGKIQMLLMKNGDLLNERLVESSILGHQAVLEYLFTNFLGLATNLMDGSGLSIAAKSQGVVVRQREIASAIYQSLFQEFDQPFHRQEVIVALVMHCGSSGDGSDEMEAALECLDSLARQPHNLTAMEPFIEFLKTLMHNCHQLDPNQVRLIFALLSKFAIAQTLRDESSSAWFHIMMKKLLTHPSESSRCAGAIGAVQFIKSCCEMKRNRRTLVACSGGKNLEGEGDEDRIWKDVFDLAFGASRNAPMAMATFCEDLASEIGESSQNESEVISRDDLRKVANYVSEELSHEFLGRFVESLAETADQKCTNEQVSSSSSLLSASSTSSSSLPTQPRRLKSVPCFDGKLVATFQYNLDGDDSPIALRLLPNFALGHADPRVQDRYVYLCSLLRCSVIFTTISKRDYDAVLGCPILLPESDMVESLFEGQGTVVEDEEGTLSAMRAAVFLSYYYSIHWIREVINCFAQRVDDANFKHKILARFEHLKEVEKTLERLAVSENGKQLLYLLPLNHVQASVLGAGSPTTKKGGANKSGASSSGSSKANLKSDLLEDIRGSYRPFRFCVLDVLKSGKELVKCPSAVETALATLRRTLQENLGSKKKGPLGVKKKASTRDPYEQFRERISKEKLIETISPLFKPIREISNELRLRELRTRGNDEDEDVEEEIFVRHCLTSIVESIHELVVSRAVKSDRILRDKVLDGFATFCVSGPRSTEADTEEEKEMEILETGDDIEVITKVSEVLRTWLLRAEAGGMDLKLAIIDTLVDLSKFLRTSDMELNEKISSHCIHVLGETESSIKLSKQIIGKLLELHIKLFPSPVQRCAQIAADLGHVASSTIENGELLPTMSISNLAQFYEPVFKCLAYEFDRINFSSCMPSKGAKRKRSKLKSKKSKMAKMAKKMKGKKKVMYNPDEDDAEEDEENEEIDDENEEQEVAEGDQEGEREGEREEEDEDDEERDEAVELGDPAAVFNAAYESIIGVKDLISITRSCGDRKTVLHVATKQGCAFLEKVMKSAIPFFEIYFRTNPSYVRKALKSIQGSTRQLQSICEFGKKKGDSTLMTAVPKLRKLMENLTYSAKRMCIANNCSDIFSTGKLKRRNVDGTEIIENSDEEEEPEEGGENHGQE